MRTEQSANGHKCVFYVIPNAGPIAVCRQAAPFLYHGSSFCAEHIAEAVRGTELHDRRTVLRSGDHR